MRPKKDAPLMLDDLPEAIHHAVVLGRRASAGL